MDIDVIRQKLILKRHKLGLNLEDVCDGFSRQTLSRFEKGGDITLSNVIKLANKLNCNLNVMV